MNIAEFLHKNIAWNIHKNTFYHLCCAPTSEAQLFAQLHRLADRYFPERKRVETAYTEFCLNAVALSSAKTAAEQCVKHHFNTHWQNFVRLQAVFAKNYMLLPSDGKLTRLERIAELVAQCTQFAVTDNAIAQICERVREMFHLEERESRNLENVLALYKINYFCALAQEISDKNPAAETRLAKMLDISPLQSDFVFNTNLRHCYYSTGKLVANVDCLANSATKFNVPTAIDVRTYLYSGGRNVFDTFCNSKFGTHTAEFYSKSESLRISMQYFLEDTREVRRYTVVNLGKSKQITADFLIAHTNPSAKRTFFEAEGALCLSVESSENFYCALALVADNKIVPCPFEEGRLSHQFALPQGAQLQFDLVTLFAENMPALSDGLALLNCYGTTRCPYVADTPSQNVVNFHHPLHPTPHGYVKRTAPQRESTTLNFTYQLGNDNVGTFLDNAGNCTTLLNGFAFGVGGEKVYGVQNGILTQLNCGQFALQADNVLYKKSNGTVCKIVHDTAKNYCVQHSAPAKTLFLFPFEEIATVERCENTFTVSGKLRKFTVTCLGKVESFTTNSLECNTKRLRYKLSNNLSCGNCLAICFATAKSAQVQISSLAAIPQPQPLVRESLVSTYLNYVNSKNAFCLNNFLKRADSLTLAAINFTNPQFVKQYIGSVYNKNLFYYDVAGRQKKFFDKLALPLAVVYYASMHDDESFPSEELKLYVKGVMFNEQFSGRDLCVKALLLKKAANIKWFDKVQCLIEYNTVKKAIVTDSKLYGYAQAIGAVPMLHPGKERLKDLCNRYEIPKSWYYVSQLENLYGLSLVEGVLNFTPKVTQENVLEQLALNVCGKRIETSFAKSTVQSMTLNGVQYFIPFKPQSLKNQNNTLVVRY